MKNFAALAICLTLTLVACDRQRDDDNNNYAAVPVDTYCYYNGYNNDPRCPGFNSWSYNQGYYNYYYGNSPVWSQYNYASGGCGAGYLPTYSSYGFACYYAAATTGYNYYMWNGYLLACAPTLACPSGYACSNAYGSGFCY